MAIYAHPKRFDAQQLGVIPAAVVAVAAGLEAAWAWYDPDLFDRMWLEADQEKQVETLNNQWVLLERTAWATLPSDDDARVELESTIDQWNRWKIEYHEAVLRRWIPFVGRDWDDELLRWFESLKSQAARVARAGGEEARRQMDRAGYDEKRLPERDKSIIEQAGELVEQAGEAAEEGAGNVGTGFFWPALALGASAGLIIWMMSSQRKNAVSG